VHRRVPFTDEHDFVKRLRLCISKVTVTGRVSLRISHEKLPHYRYQPAHSALKKGANFFLFVGMKVLPSEMEGLWLYFVFGEE
jgi:hypothetical protein